MRRSIMVWVTAVLMFVSIPWTQARAGDYPDTPQGLEQLVHDVVDALKDDKTDTAKQLIGSMVLPNPDAWFTKTFGEDRGKVLAANYAKFTLSFPEMGLKLFQDQVKQNRINVKAYKVEAADDKQATGGQVEAILSMKEKSPLYGVRMIAPGKEYGLHLWSFVYVDGNFRMIGKMADKK